MAKAFIPTLKFWEEEAQDPPRGAAESEPTEQQDPDPKSPTSKDDAAGEREREREREKERENSYDGSS
jgi:hypothetical protein